MRLTLVAFECVIGWFAFPPGVSAAATVELAKNSTEPYGRGWASIDYRAAVGETNQITLFQVDDMTIRVTDRGAVIAPGRACRSVNAHSARCSVAGLRDYNGLIGANVHAGDMDDVVDSQGPGLSADGGPGDDILRSSSVAAGTLDGGGGRDTLLGGTNRDTLTDGDASGAADSDVLDGREGGAIVSYASRTAPVHVDLADQSSGGEVGEHDTIRGVTGVTGGRGADKLQGDDTSNLLEGGPGADQLEGLGGDDFLDGGPGADRVAAHTGDDFIAGGPGRDLARGGKGRDGLDGGRGSDRLRGGDGPDSLASGAAWCGRSIDVAWPDANDFVSRDCEQAQFTLRMTEDEIADSKRITVRPYPSIDDRSSMTFHAQCPHTETDGYPNPVEFRGTLRIRTSDGRLLGTGRIPNAGQRCGTLVGYEGASELPWIPIGVRLNSAGQDLLTRTRALVIVDFTGRNVPTPWSIRLPTT